MSLQLQGVARRVDGVTCVRDIDLDLEDGSLTVLLGPIGAGKTSLLRVMAGLDAPSEGRALLDGERVHRVPPRRRRVGFVHQAFVNYPNRSVRQNLAAPLERSGVDARRVQERVEDVARLLRIEPFLDRKPAELSGGQQQRTALARALARGEGLLLLDEPLVNLDYKLREELRFELRAIFERGTHTIVYATSDPSEALAIGGTTAVLDRGRLLQQGPALAVYREPATRRVADLTSVPSMNWTTGRLDAHGWSVEGAAPSPRVPAHLTGIPGGELRFGVRPHQATLERRSASDLQLEGRVSLAELSGSETFLHVDLESTARRRAWVLHRPGTEPHEPGETVSLFVDPAHLHAFDPAGRLLAAPGS